MHKKIELARGLYCTKCSNFLQLEFKSAYIQN